MSKIILDTSVLAYHPTAFYEFPKEKTEIIIPIAVLEELDKLKTFPNEVGKNARICIRKIDELSKLGELHKGVVVNNQTIRVETKEASYDSYADNRILATALAQKGRKHLITVVSRDVNLRIRAKAFGLGAEDYDRDRKNVTELYTGFQQINSQKIGEILSTKNSVNCADFKELENLMPNECVYVKGEDSKGYALGRRIGDKVKIITNKKPWGVESRSREQAFCFDLLMDNRIPLVSMTGIAGTGKSLLALCCAMEACLEKKTYSKIVIYRPIASTGASIGFLPGSLEEKLAPYLEPIMDNLEVLFSMKDGNNWKRKLDYVLERGLLEMQAISFIRGRSMNNICMLVDEAQNLSKEELKTIITRVGVGSRVILTGDIGQIDIPSLDASNNGLTYVIEKFKDSEMAGHITLTKGERSALATLAADIL